MKRKVTTQLNCTVESASDTGVGCVTEDNVVTMFNKLTPRELTFIYQVVPFISLV